MDNAIKKVNLLPLWCLTGTLPAFYDTESATAIEQTAKLYGAVRELQEFYNKFAEEVNKVLTEAINNMEQDQTDFEARITKLVHDYIALIDSKIASQDKVINDAVLYMKDNISSSVADLISQMKETGELDTAILNSLNNLESRLSTLENRENNSFGISYNESTKSLNFNN